VLTGVTGTDYSWPKSKLVLALPLYDKQVYSTFSSGTPVLVALRQGTFQGMAGQSGNHQGRVEQAAGQESPECTNHQWRAPDPPLSQ
jgi:hypothetical protein